ncbi:MAG: OmpA family protein [Thermodesulfobacteriota bacterium]|nr:OmpA family protein [Thermodesulfobacteriota bacterium]
MTKKILTACFFLIIGIFLISCTCKRPAPLFESSSDLNSKWKAGHYVQKVDNFLILLDASSSMDFCYQGQQKLHIAKDFVNSMNRTMPDMKLVGGLSAFGTGSCLSNQKSVLTYGMTEYVKDGLFKGVEQVTCAGGNTPLAYTINNAKEILGPTKGKIACIIISDGRETNMDPAPEKAVKDLKNEFGDRLCLYTVLIGDDIGGKALLEQIATAGKCGFSIAADSIASKSDMADFVKKIFLDKACPKPVALAPAAPPQAPKLAPPVKTSPEKRLETLENIYFNTDKWDIKQTETTKLKKVVNILKNKPTLKLNIDGHTDSRESETYNQTLSGKRSDSVSHYLIQKGISADRVYTYGHGESRPAVPNDSLRNMRLNRRVELKLIR